MPTHKLHTQHSRLFDDNRFVYPVLSRRSRGISVGVNLNPDKVCNFDCVYCQVDRTHPGGEKFVELDRLVDELRSTLKCVATGSLFQMEGFSTTPPDLRRLNDIAFSGDGEPTTYRNFDEIIRRCVEVKQELGLHETKMVLITNATMLHRPAIVQGLELLDAHQGEIWAKLESGTEDYYRQIARSAVPFKRVLDNISSAAQVRPLVIQSLFMKIDDQLPSDVEIEAYCDRLSDVIAAGGKIRLVQLYTVARPPAESNVTPLTPEQIGLIASQVRQKCGLKVETY